MNLKCLRQIVAVTVVLSAAPSQANLVFNLIPESGMPQYAIDGFYAAAGLWSSVLADDVTVNLDIGFTSLGGGILGQSGSSFIETSYSNVRQALSLHRTSAADYSSYAALQSGSSFNRLINYTSDNPNGAGSATSYVDTMDRIGVTTANAKTLGLLAPSGASDATIRFSSDFNFDFDRSDGITAGYYDFIGVAAHEIGHALGFSSGVDDLDTSGGIAPGNSFSSNLIDLYRYSPLSLAQGAGVQDFTADASAKFFSVDGGVTEIAQFATGMIHGDGRQASHWKDDLGIGLMDPTAAPGERIDISSIDLQAFDVLGYTVVPEPGAGALAGVAAALIAVRRRRR